jgi:hypothetical protein
MPKQRETGFFGGIPRKATSAAQQIDFRFNSQTNKVCHFAHYIGVSARCFPVISDQTYTFLAHHGRLMLAHPLKESRWRPDKHIKPKMLPGLTTVSLPQTYCRACHLSTRSDVVRCLHCNRPLIPAAPKRTPRKIKPRRVQ